MKEQVDAITHKKHNKSQEENTNLTATVAKLEAKNESLTAGRCHKVEACLDQKIKKGKQKFVWIKV